MIELPVQGTDRKLKVSLDDRVIEKMSWRLIETASAKIKHAIIANAKMGGRRTSVTIRKLIAARMLTSESGRLQLLQGSSWEVDPDRIKCAQVIDGMKLLGRRHIYCRNGDIFDCRRENLVLSVRRSDMPNGKPVILDLCCGSGAWSKPYRNSGLYEVRLIDVQSGTDIRTMTLPKGRVWGVLAAPPCTHFATSGARHWKEKGIDPLLEGLSIVDACLRIIMMTNPRWWALENPVGRLRKFLGDPVYSFCPSEFGEKYTKKTWLWGKFVPPQKEAEPAKDVDKEMIISASGKGAKRQAVRSITPARFAEEFFNVNP